MHEPVRLQDVAEAANVSLSTASKVMNDTGRIAAGTRRLVLETARAMGYEHHHRQPQMRQKTGLIGLVSADLEGRFALPLINGAEQTLGAANHAVLLMNSRGDPRVERRHIDQLAARGVDGLIILNGETDPRPPIRQKTVEDIPIVYAYSPSSDPSDCSVTCDNETAGYQGIRHLIEQGRRRLAVIAGDDGYLATRERLNGIKRALAEEGLRTVAPIRFGNWHESWGRTCVRMMFDEGADFDGLYAMNDQIARGAIETMLACGLEVPRDVAVIGHDNWAVTALECPVPITSFDNELETIGRYAARLLLRAVAGRETHGVTKVECSLHIRRSTVADI
ncbi:LacI family DNA-binding transcriptional regulator [Bifidobacterium sp. UBA744]|uniref:LacI family DNA-binding transcriptional regulator n=1 Tax=Bifidobacterium sp. UBA744 TaxID=1946112 RepID=UPI0025BF15D9|nr:LacI family DNA-binding transcriptional regulator [Bifidobacterium sp. UBA744]